MTKEIKNWQDEEKDWSFYYAEGESYLKTCKGLVGNKKKFDNEFLYHLAVLAGERLILGLLMSYDYIPAATSLTGMVIEGKSFYKYNDELLKGGRLINKFQNFCSLDVVALTVPNDEEMFKIVDYINSLYVFSKENLNKEVLLRAN